MSVRFTRLSFPSGPSGGNTRTPGARGRVAPSEPGSLPLCPTIVRPSTTVKQILCFSLMSHSHLTASGSSSSSFKLIIINALEAYEKRTKNNLLDHPLASQLQACDSPGDILAVLRQQIQGLDQSRSADERWTKWLDPTIHVLFTFSRTIGIVGLV